MPTTIPDKKYFRIGEVSEITGLEAYVLRFWETEFKNINPKRTDSGQRLYSHKDVQMILTIKNLLYEEKFTIQGAKKHLSISAVEKKNKPSHFTIDQLKSELSEIKNLLK
ncbi:MAG: MerR family transcriptional regulator [Proteobacteria bacterium]|nr:MerR family transcriptional regulator [Pseudomonadota bacterium]